MEPISWFTAAITLVVGLFGGGGISSYVQARTDRKRGIGQVEVSQNDAIAHRWQAIVTTQTEALVTPLRERVDELEDDLRDMKLELSTSRAKYWRAIMYIRQLQTYIIRHLPDGQPHTPDPPAEIAEDI